MDKDLSALVGRVVNAAIRLGLAERRSGLLFGLSETDIASLPEKSRPDDQLRSDVQTLVGRKIQGECGLGLWLTNAINLTEGQDGERILDAARTEIAARVQSAAHTEIAAFALSAIQLRQPRVPSHIDKRPFPLFEPIEHPDQLGGRDGDLATLDDVLSGSARIAALYAPSGYGKTSFIKAGLAPRLQAKGAAVVINRRPEVSGLAQRLIQALIEDPQPYWLGPTHLVALLHRIRKQQAPAPVFVLDQFEELFKLPDAEAMDAQRRVGELLSRTFEPGVENAQPMCRWLLGYRQEFHGLVTRWLRDVFVGQAPPKGLAKKLIPSGDWARPLAPLGWERPEADFLDAITRPLSLHNGAWTFADGHAERLAESFAAVRQNSATRLAPLLLDLQVVLREIFDASDGQALKAPLDIQNLLTNALERHVTEVLARAFIDHDQPVIGQTLAVVALLRLVDDEGRARVDGLPDAELKSAVDPAILERLTAPEARLLVATLDTQGKTAWRLSHDQLAVVVQGLAKDPNSGLEQDLIQLNALIGNRASEYARQPDDAALSLSARNTARIASSKNGLLWNAERADWWRAQEAFEARRAAAAQRRMRNRIRQAVVAVVLVVSASVGARWAWTHFSSQTAADKKRLAEQTAENEILSIVSAFGSDSSLSRDEVEALMRLRSAPLKIKVRVISRISSDASAALRYRANRQFINRALFGYDPVNSRIAAEVRQRAPWKRKTPDESISLARVLLGMAAVADDPELRRAAMDGQHWRRFQNANTQPWEEWLSWLPASDRHEILSEGLHDSPSLPTSLRHTTLEKLLCRATRQSNDELGESRDRDDRTSQPRSSAQGEAAALHCGLQAAHFARSGSAQARWHLHRRSTAPRGPVLIASERLASGP